MANDQGALDSVMETHDFLREITQMAQPGKHTKLNIQGLESFAERLKEIKKSLTRTGQGV